MRKFEFEVTDGFFPQTFEGEVEAKTEQEAIEILKDDYAVMLDTMPEEIQVQLHEK